MNKVLIFGVGSNFKLKETEIKKTNRIIGFIDNYFNEATFNDLKVYKLEEIERVDYDKIIICSMYFTEIANQLLKWGIDGEKIEFSFKYEYRFPYETLLEKEGYEIIIENNELKFSDDKVLLNLKNENNFLVARETFLEHEYGYYPDRDKEYIAIDIGANIGDTAMYFAKWENIKKVYAYEPCEETFFEAKKNIKESRLENKIELFKFGLGEKREKLKIKYSNVMSGSMSSIVDNSLTVDESKIELKNVEIQIESFIAELENILKNKKEEKIIIKMDCEGAEFGIFKSLIEKEILLKDIECIMLEWHFGNENDIVNFLRENKYKVICKKRDYKFGMIYAMK